MHDALAVATPTTNKECANASHRSNNKERQNFPFSLTGTDADRISAKVKTFPRLPIGPRMCLFAGDGQAPTVGPSQVVALRTAAFNAIVFPIPSSNCFASAPLFLLTRRLEMKDV